MSSFAHLCIAVLFVVCTSMCMVCAQGGLSGKVLTVAAEKWQPWFVISQGNEEHHAYSGVSYKILQFLENALNFTSKIVRPSDGSWGSKDDSGVWGGMVGMVKRHEADFGLGPFSVNDQRAQVIEYTIPVYVDDQVALIPYKPSRNQAVLIKVFDWRIWLTLLFLTPAYIIVCGLSTRLFMGQVNWWAQVDFALRTLCMDSAYPRIPQERNYNKILSFTWIWGCFVLFAAYSGNLKSTFVRPSQPEIIGSVDELVRQDKIEWFFPNKGSFELRGKNAEEGSTLSLIFQKGIPFRGSCERTVDQVRTGRFSHICEKLSAQKVISSEFGSNRICEFYTTKPILTLPYAMVFKKGSPYIDLVNEKLQLLQQLGLIETWINDAVANASNCNTLSQVVNSHKKDDEASLNLNQIDSIFFVLLCGLLLSTAGFAGEAIKSRCWIGRGDTRVQNPKNQD